MNTIAVKHETVQNIFLTVIDKLLVFICDICPTTWCKYQELYYRSGTGLNFQHSFQREKTL